MPSNTIKGLTVEIGGDTTKLSKALKDVESKSKSLSKELGDVNKLLKFDPHNVDLLTQKQQILAEATENTKEKLDILRKAEKQVQEQFERGEVSVEQVRALQREIVVTENKIKGYERASKETAEAIEQVGQESSDTSKKLDNVSQSSKEAEKSAEDLGSSLDVDLKGGLLAVTAAASAAATAIIGCAESSREYRTEMGKLDTAFTANNFSGETAKNTYKELQSILGETDQAVEAANHLSKLASNEADLAQWTEICTGIYAQFGASLPIEGLTESANESAKVGQVTGSLADALNWAATEGETFGVVLKENTKENKEWNDAVNKAKSAEDYFNLALQECTDEQERQRLIMKTLSKQYSGIAKQYKRTNEEVIRANKANEEWNETLAEIGETVDPVVTDIKELGTEMLKSAQKPIEETSEFVQNKLLPAIRDVSEWAEDNLPMIKAGLIGITAAMVAYKAAVVATEIAHNGVKGAIMATEAAQKALNIVQAASPWGLLAVAIGSVAAALVAYSIDVANTSESVNFLTDNQKQLMEATDEAAESFRKQQEATQENISGVQSQMDYITDLADELHTLAGSSGEVQEADQARVDFILGELNSALGTEYLMVDGVIQKYDELTTNIYNVIAAKQADALIEAYTPAWAEAVKNQSDAMETLNLRYQDYQNQLKITAEKEAEYEEQRSIVQQRTEEGYYKIYSTQQQTDAMRLSQLEYAYRTESGVLSQKESDYNTAASNYANYSNTIMNYEDAQVAAAQGNYQAVSGILTQKGAGFQTYEGVVDDSTKNVLSTLEQEAIDAGLKAQKTKKNFENGVDGFTEEMVKEAEAGYQEALDAYSSAYADAYSIGSNFGSGAGQGMEDMRESFVDTARRYITDALSAMASAAGIASPAKETIKLMRFFGKGSVVGLKSTTKELLGAAREQVELLIAEYQPMISMSREFDRELAYTANNSRYGYNATGQVTNTNSINVTNHYDTPTSLSYADMERLKRKEHRELIARLMIK